MQYSDTGAEPGSSTEDRRRGGGRGSRPSLMTDNHLYPHMHRQGMRTPRLDREELAILTENQPQSVHVSGCDLQMVTDVLDSLPDVDHLEGRRYDGDGPDSYLLEDLIPELEDMHVSQPTPPGGRTNAQTSCRNLPSARESSSGAEGSSLRLQLAAQTRLKASTGNRDVASCVSNNRNIHSQPLTVETSAADMEVKYSTLQKEFFKRQESKAYQIMQLYRQRLPVWGMRDTIVDTIARNQVVVICGETGCGKTTQVPQFILDDALQKSNCLVNIVCTQPRRIAAISVAQRVAKERDEELGRCVGYKMRFESATSPYTRLLFCTTGIILLQLKSDPELQKNHFTHIIIDEVHERSADSDFLLMNLRLLLKERRDLRVVLMSATINASLFSEFFGGCPVFQIPGHTYEVRQHFLEDVIDKTHYQCSRQARANPKNAKWGRTVTDEVEDKDLTENELQLRYPGYGMSVIRTLASINMDDNIDYDLIVMLVIWIARSQEKKTQKGAILIFMPGLAEIENMYTKLEKNSELGRLTELHLVPLHSSLSTEEQNEAFSEPDDGVTKIVIATNIAETSITIDDIVYVIDSGLMKEKRYDHRKHMDSLDVVAVSRANVTQRKGRAGRVRNGVSFHMFTSHRYKHHMRDQPVPEILRISLEQLVLKVKMMPTFVNRSVEEVLAKLLDPPSQESIDGAVTRLSDLGALDENEELTALGYYVALLPVDVRIGKLMLFGAIFRCLDPALTIAAMFSYKTPFITPFDAEKREQARERKMEFAAGNSDFLTLLNAYKGWYEAKLLGARDAKQYCYTNFLSVGTLQMLVRHKQQFVELLSDIGFIQTGIRVRDLQRTAHVGSDGVADVTGIEANENSNNWDLISAILLAALYPNIAVKSSGLGALTFLVRGLNATSFNTRDGTAQIHPSSVTFKVQTFSHPFLVYHEKVKTKRVYIRDCSEVPALALLLFGGGKVLVEQRGFHTLLLMDNGWIKLKFSSVKAAETLLALRKELNQLLSVKMANPDTDLVASERGSRVIRCIVDLVSAQSRSS